MILCLVRHGNTIGNEKHLYYGATDLPVTQEGLSALKILSGVWSSAIPENCRFITSGMLRTENTLIALFGNREFRSISDFREINFGAFEMRGYEELKDDPEYIEWISGDNFSNTPPGGESAKDFSVRVNRAIDELIAEDEDTVLVTHGGVIATVMAHLFPDEKKNFYEWQPKPGYGYIINTKKKSYRLLA